MSKVSVGSVSKILLMLTKILYVVQYKRSTLTSTDDFLLQQSRTVIVILQLHYHILCMSFDYASRLFGNVIVLFPDD